MHNYKSKDFINSEEKIALLKYVCEGNEEVHSHEFIEIEYIYQGCGYQEINGSTFYVEKGDLIFLNFKDSHSIKPTNNLGIINCLFNPEFFSSALVNSENALDILALTSFEDFDKSAVKSSPKMRFLDKELIELEVLMGCMKNEFDEKLPGYITVLESYAKILLVKIFRNDRLNIRLNVYTDIKKITPGVIKYIEDNYNKKLSLTDLAKQSFYTPTYFSTVFKECYGKSVIEYINERRIEAAISILKNTQDTIESICYQVGFNDKKQFFKLFKSLTGMTPKTYRNCIERNPTTF